MNSVSGIDGDNSFATIEALRHTWIFRSSDIERCPNSRSRSSRSVRWMRFSLIINYYYCWLFLFFFFWIRFFSRRLSTKEPFLTHIVGGGGGGDGGGAYEDKEAKCSIYDKQLTDECVPKCGRQKKFFADTFEFRVLTTRNGTRGIRLRCNIYGDPVLMVMGIETKRKFVFPDSTQRPLIDRPNRPRVWKPPASALVVVDKTSSLIL